MISTYVALSLVKHQSGSVPKIVEGKIKTTSRVSFVFSCKIGDEASGIPRLKKILDKIASAMKK